MGNVWKCGASRRPVLLLAALAAACIAGCGGGDDADLCHPVRGRVFYKGKPVAEGMVFFHRLDGDNAQRPMAVTNADGRFTLTTTRKGDGAPAGEYIITVELRDLRPDGDEMIRDGRNLLPVRYRDPKTSGLKYTVRSGDNEVPAIQLK